METVTFTDPDGNTLPYCKIDGVILNPFPGLESSLAQARNLKLGEDDLLITAYPRSGTHLIWEIAKMLKNGSADYVTGEKEDDYLELLCFNGIQSREITKGTLNTHLPPKLLPLEILSGKCKIVHVYRNPKDVFVSLYNHILNNEMLAYRGTFSTFFELAIKGQVEYGSWFDYELAYEELFQSHPEIPSLSLGFDDLTQVREMVYDFDICVIGKPENNILKNATDDIIIPLQNSVEAIRQIALFLGLPEDNELFKTIADATAFKKMKAGKFNVSSEMLKRLITDEKYNSGYRKGISGDWKNWFTVAQEERFNAEFERRMGRSSLSMKWK